jgi:peptidoglycan/xylan/chitin deacetylase (PgdA/CDA1 family)
MTSFRADRFATLCLFYPLRRIIRPRQGSIPILMYHSISEPGEGGGHPYYETATAPRVFAEHIEFLFKNDYKTVSLADVVAQTHAKQGIGGWGLGACQSKIQDPESDSGQDAFVNPQSSIGNPALPACDCRSATKIQNPESKVGRGHQRSAVSGQQSGLPTTYDLRPTARIQNPKSKVDKKPVVITFDDGYLDFYVHAFPILSRYGYGATMFLPTAFIGETPRKFKDAPCLTWSQVRELHRAGVTFGSHTVNHPRLTQVAPAQRNYEVRQSKLTIEERLGCEIDSFAYPYAFPAADHKFTESLQRMLEDAGYKNGVSTVTGRADAEADIYFMKRLPVNTHDDLRFFRAKLEGGYDWTHTPQYLWKKLGIRHWLLGFRSCGAGARG